MDNTLVAIVIGAIAIYVGYNFYAKRIDRDVIQASAGRATPARMYMDGVDFVPTSRNVLYGYHFKSIAAAGPIVGAITAAALWGWLPSLIWLVLGVSAGTMFAVERFEGCPVSGRPVPESGPACRIEPGQEVGDEVDDPGVEDGVEPDVRVDSFGPAMAVFIGSAFRERSERHLPCDLEDPQIRPAGPAQEVARPGLQAAADGNESVEGGELPDIAEARLPGMDFGSRREDEPDVGPVAGDGPGELGQGEDRGHDPESPPALAGWRRGREKHPAGAEDQDQNGRDLGFNDHAGLPGDARAL